MFNIISRIVPKETTDKDYIRIFKGAGCYSYTGMIGGPQSFSLGRGCVGGGHFGIIIRELMHALGNIFSISRLFRDQTLINMYAIISCKS